MLLLHCIRRAASRAASTAGSSSEIKMPMIVITTKSSISVKPCRGWQAPFAPLGGDKRAGTAIPKIGLSAIILMLSHVAFRFNNKGSGHSAPFNHAQNSRV